MSARRFCCVAGAATLWLGSAAAAMPAQAKVRNDAEPAIAACLARAAEGRPWLEATLWGLRDQEGGWLGAEQPNRNGTHDLGPLQINSAWVPAIAAKLGRGQSEVRGWLKHDACFNAGVAKWIFVSEYQQRHDYWAAVGGYHSPTAWRARDYAVKVAGRISSRFGPAIYTRPGIVLAQANSYPPPAGMQRRPSLPVAPGSVVDALRRHGQAANQAIDAELQHENEMIDQQLKDGRGREAVEPRDQTTSPPTRWYGIARASAPAVPDRASQAGSEGGQQSWAAKPARPAEVVGADGRIDFSTLTPL